MKLSDLKWWHWTLATVAVAAVVRLATGGPLPFLTPPPAPAKPAMVAGRPAREPNTGSSMTQAAMPAGFVIERASPELRRLTIEATIPNPGDPAGLVGQSGVLVREIARALQAGVAEDSSDIAMARVLVATKGTDRTGKAQTHLPLYALDFKIADLYALKPRSASPAEALGLATAIVFNGADAHDAARAWCKVPANFNQALAFCSQVTAAKGV
jgi:hypothetical protein